MTQTPVSTPKSAIILAGGFGTRLRPLTCFTPKPLLPVLNKPFLHYQLDILQRYGVSTATLALGRFNASHFGKWYEKCNYKRGGRTAHTNGIKVKVSIEEAPLGTGGAVRHAWQDIDGPVIVFNGDILTDVNIARMAAFHKKAKSVATIALAKVGDPTRYGLIETSSDGRIVRFLEKPKPEEVPANVDTINAGIYILEPQVLENIPMGREVSIEREVFPSILAQGLPFFGFNINGYWLDVGTVSSYRQVHYDLLNGRAGAAFSINSGSGKMNRKLKNVFIEKGVKISRTAVFEGKTLIGTGSVIGESVSFKETVSIGSKCSVGQKAVISGSVVLNNVSVGERACLDGCVVGNGSVIESDAYIGPGTVLGDGSVVKTCSRCG